MHSVVASEAPDTVALIENGGIRMKREQRVNQHTKSRRNAANAMSRIEREGK